MDSETTHRKTELVENDPIIADDGLAVVAPYTGQPTGKDEPKVVTPRAQVPTDSPCAPPGKEATTSDNNGASKANPTASKTAASFALDHSKLVSLILGGVIALVVGAWLYSNQSEKENRVARNTEAALLSEYSLQPEQAALNWRKAISSAKAMNAAPKTIADMDVSAAKNWMAVKENQTAEAPEQRNSPSALKKLNQMDTLIEDYLREAIRLYASVENCNFEQVRASEMLVGNLCSPIYYDQVSAGFFFSNAESDTNVVDGGSAAKINKKFAAKDPAAIEEASIYLDRVKDPTAIFNAFIVFASQPANDTKYSARLMPLLHRMVYYEHSQADRLINSQVILDELIRRGGNNPSDAKVRLGLADALFQKKDYVGAIVEYARVLGVEDDNVEARKKFLQAQQLLAQLDPTYAATAKNNEETISVLLSLSKLKASCFGENSPERQRTLKDLANAYELAGQYDRSESLFESFCHPGAIYKDVWAESSAHIALAKLYAVEGKYKLAAAQFKQPIRVYGMTAAQFWARLADLYIRAGLFNEAKESMRMATLHAPGDTFSSGGGSSSAPTVE